jgi:hypothetical protein
MTSASAQHVRLIVEDENIELRRWLERDDVPSSACPSENDVRPILHSQCVATQEFLYKSGVDFYVQCIQRGCYPPPCEGVQFEDSVWITDGVHRANAWVRVGFLFIPIRVYANLDDPADTRIFREV